MSGTTFDTKQIVYFSCDRDIRVGAITLREGESIKAVSNGMGKFNLYVEWVEGSIGVYSAEKVNDLAGKEVVS